MNTQDRDQMMSEAMAWFEQTDAVAQKLMKEQPDLHPVTARVIAGDIMSASRATQEVEAGVAATEAVHMVGSFVRWDWVVTMVRLGKIDEAWFAENICDLWRSADPDDTSVENLRIWQTARRANGGMIRDGKPFPKGKAVPVFRGGRPNTVSSGFAWTTDPKIARKFANGAGERIEIKGGIVIGGWAKPADVLAYITLRGESEVIINPHDVADLRVVGAN